MSSSTTQGHDWNSGNQKVIETFRANGGTLGGDFAGAQLLLLHTIGAHSGRERINPTMYQDLGNGRLAIFASKGGAPTNPDWYYNLRAHPDVTIEIGTETRRVHAHTVTGPERERIWAKQKHDFPQFAGYEAKMQRQIPVVVLEPR